MFKQALRASGADVTFKHIEEVSLCALFLIEAAKKADSDFQVPPQSTSHTVRDSANDIKKISAYVREKDINKEVTSCTSPPFFDPTESGFKNIMCKPKWIEGILKEKSEEQAEETIQNEINLDYKLVEMV